MVTALKWAALIFALFLLFHWTTAGQDEIIEGPPECLDASYTWPDCPTK